jgi:hypothetical protein
MRIENVIVELEAIESVRAELRAAHFAGASKHKTFEILSRLITLYSALNVTDIKENLESQIYDERKAA